MRTPIVLLMITSNAALSEPANVPSDLSKDYDFAGVVTSLYELQSNAGLPARMTIENSPRDGTEFDVMSYFTLLHHIVPPKGYILDYIYFYCNGNGIPYLIFRTETNRVKRNLSCEDDLDEERTIYSSMNFGWWNYLVLDETPESYLEKIVVQELGEQFYLSWHALWYKKSLVANKRVLEQIIQENVGRRYGRALTRRQQHRMRRAKLDYWVRFRDELTAEISLVWFTDWDGLFRTTWILDRNYPYRQVEKPITKPLVEYDCQVAF